MSKWEKLLNKVMELDRSLRFDELQKLLESMGYSGTAPKSGSSHYTFRKTGSPPVTIPKKSPINKAYIQMVKEIILSEEEQQ